MRRRLHRDWIRLLKLLAGLALLAAALAFPAWFLMMNRVGPRAKLTALRSRVDQAVRVGDLEAAATLAERSVRLDPDNPVLHRRLGELRISTGQFSAGLAALERACQLDPDDVKARLLLCDIALSTGEVAAARRHLDGLPEDAAIAGYRPALSLLRFELAWVEGNVAEAGRHADDALARSPLSARAHEARARLAFARGEAELARTLLARGLELAPRDAHLRVLLSRVLEELGDIEGAQRVVAPLRPGSDVGTQAQLRRLGELLARAHDWGGLNELRRLLPESAAASRSYLSALVAEVEGDREAAIASCREALALQPFLSDVRLTLARLSLEQGEVSAAEAELRAILDEQPLLRPARTLCGQALLHLGRHDQAAEMAEELLRVAPESAAGMCLLLVACHRLGEPERARSFFVDRLAARPASRVAPIGLRLALLLGREPDALMPFDRRVAWDRVNVGGLEGLARLERTRRELTGPGLLARGSYQAGDGPRRLAKVAARGLWASAAAGGGARDVAERSTRLDAEAEAPFLAAVTAFAAGDLARARSEAEWAVVLGSQPAEWVRLHVLLATGQWDEARRLTGRSPELREVTALGALRALAWQGLADYAQRLPREQVLAVGRPFHDLLVAAQRGDRAEAEKQVAKLPVELLRHPAPAIGAARALVGVGAIESAERLLTDARLASPGSGALLEALAVVQLVRNDEVAAFLGFQQARALSPSGLSPEVRRLLLPEMEDLLDALGGAEGRELLGLVAARLTPSPYRPYRWTAGREVAARMLLAQAHLEAGDGQAAVGQLEMVLAVDSDEGWAEDARRLLARAQKMVEAAGDGGGAASEPLLLPVPGMVSQTLPEGGGVHLHRLELAGPEHLTLRYQGPSTPPTALRLLLRRGDELEEVKRGVRLEQRLEWSLGLGAGTWLVEVRSAQGTPPVGYQLETVREAAPGPHDEREPNDTRAVARVLEIDRVCSATLPHQDRDVFRLPPGLFDLDVVAPADDGILIRLLDGAGAERKSMASGPGQRLRLSRLRVGQAGLFLEVTADRGLGGTYRVTLEPVPATQEAGWTQLAEPDDQPDRRPGAGPLLAPGRYLGAVDPAGDADMVPLPAEPVSLRLTAPADLDLRVRFVAPWREDWRVKRFVHLTAGEELYLPALRGAGLLVLSALDPKQASPTPYRLELGPAASDTELEPNDLPADASAFTPGRTTLHGRFDRPEDVDCYRLGPGTRQTVTVWPSSGRLRIEAIASPLPGAVERIRQHTVSWSDGPLVIDDPATRRGGLLRLSSEGATSYVITVSR